MTIYSKNKLNEGIAGFFDMLSCGVYTSVNAPKEILNIWHGHDKKGIKDDKKTVENLKPSDQIRFVDYYSLITHEFRHFHDYVGTSYGCYEFIKNIEGIYYFLLLFTQLPRGTSINVPLYDWALKKNCPSIIRNFVNDEKERSLYSSWYFGSEHYQLKARLSNSFIQFFKERTSQLKIPGLYVCTKEADIPCIFPLGGRSVLEGAALLVQLEHIKLALGIEYSSKLRSHMLEIMFNSLNHVTWPYLTCEIISSLYKEDSWINSFLLAWLDFSLMGDYFGKHETKKPKNLFLHPGYRFLKILDHILGKKAPDTKKDLLEIIQGFQDIYPQYSTTNSMSNAADYCRKLSKTIRQKTGKPHILYLIIENYLTWQNTMSDLRARYPFLLGSPHDYLAARSNLHLPEPPYLGMLTADESYGISYHKTTNFRIEGYDMSMASIWISFYILNALRTAFLYGWDSTQISRVPPCPLSDLQGFHHLCSGNPEECNYSEIAMDSLGSLWPSILPKKPDCPYQTLLSALGFYDFKYHFL